MNTRFICAVSTSSEDAFHITAVLNNKWLVVTKPGAIGFNDLGAAILSAS